MKKKGLHLVLAAIITLCTVLPLWGCGMTAQNSEYFKLLKEGDEALADGRIDDALAAYQKAIDNDPSVPQAYHRMFDTYVRDEQYDGAVMFALQNYKNISMEMSDSSDVPYKSENSVYAGLTPRQEAAAFLTDSIDMGLHLKSTYPQKQMTDYIDYACEVQGTLESPELTAVCTDFTEFSKAYTGLTAEMRDADVLVGEDLDALSPSELYDRGLTEPEPDQSGWMDLREKTSVPAETADRFVKELQALSEKDPDLIFLYFDIANLYIQSGRRSQADAVYREAIQALKEMAERRGYISEAVSPLFENTFSNLYFLGHNAAYVSAGKPNEMFYSYLFYSTSGDPHETITTPEEYKEAMDAVHKEADALPLTDAARRGIDSHFTKYSSLLERTIGSAEGVAIHTATKVDGEADLLVLSPKVLRPGTFLPDSGWMTVTYGGYYTAEENSKPEYISEKSDLINIYKGTALDHSTSDIILPWRLCEDKIIQFRVVDPANPDSPSNSNIVSSFYSSILYMIITDLDGNMLEKKNIYHVDSGDIKYERVYGEDGAYSDYIDEDQRKAFIEEAEQSIEDALSEYPEYTNDDWEEISAFTEVGRLVFEVSGVRFSRDLSEEDGLSESDSRGYVNGNTVVLNWGGTKYPTDIYRLR